MKALPELGFQRRPVMNKKKDQIQITVPNKAEFVTLIRLALSGLAGKCALTLDEVGEMKLAVSEACNHMVEETKNSESSIMCDIYNKKMIFHVNNYFANQLCPRNRTRRNIGLRFINTFMDKIERDGISLLMEKKLP